MADDGDDDRYDVGGARLRTTEEGGIDRLGIGGASVGEGVYSSQYEEGNKPVEPSDSPIYQSSLTTCFISTT